MITVLIFKISTILRFADVASCWRLIVFISDCKLLCRPFDARVIDCMSCRLFRHECGNVRCLIMLTCRCWILYDFIINGDANRVSYAFRWIVMLKWYCYYVIIKFCPVLTVACLPLLIYVAPLCTCLTLIIITHMYNRKFA